MSETQVQELLDREAIRELKARYIRLVDLKEWDAWRRLFTDDLHVEMQGTTLEGAGTYVDTVRGMIGHARSVHHEHTPELAFTEPDEAEAVWAQFVYLEWPSEPASGERRGVKVYGRCHETYRRVGGEWKIACHKQSEIRIDPLYSEPLPDSIISGAPVQPGSVAR